MKLNYLLTRNLIEKILLLVKMDKELYNFLKEIFKSPTFDEVLMILTKEGVGTKDDLE